MQVHVHEWGMVIHMKSNYKHVSPMAETDMTTMVVQMRSNPVDKHVKATDRCRVALLFDIDIK